MLDEYVTTHIGFHKVWLEQTTGFKSVAMITSFNPDLICYTAKLGS